MYIILLKTIILGAIVRDAGAWGHQAHFITVKIALSFLTDDGERLLRDVLVESGSTIEQSLYEASIWPDAIKSDPSYAWSHHLHFINIPDRVCDGFNLTRDCGNPESPGNCLVSAIANYTSRIENRDLDPSSRKEAMKFLVHFAADITQPMHVAFSGDRGGNNVRITPPWDQEYVLTAKRKVKRLHHIWDTHILQYVLSSLGKNWAELADDMINLIKGEGFIPETTGMGALRYATLTAADTANLSCEFAYKDRGDWLKSGDSLSSDYYDNASGIVMQQLAIAGLDIARYINQLGESLLSGEDISSDEEEDMEVEDSRWENVLGSPDYENEFFLF
jgi:hypothetical protein